MGLETLMNLNCRAPLSVSRAENLDLHDLNAMASRTERYYTVLKAPHKELIWFERSGHAPCFEEAGAFNHIMVDKVLAETRARL